MDHSQFVTPEPAQRAVFDDAPHSEPEADSRLLGTPCGSKELFFTPNQPAQAMSFSAQETWGSSQRLSSPRDTPDAACTVLQVSPILDNPPGAAELACEGSDQKVSPNGSESEQLQAMEEQIAERDQQVQEAAAQVVELRQAIRDFRLETDMAKAILVDALRAERLNAASAAGCASPQPPITPGSSLTVAVTALANLHLSLQERYLEEVAARRRLHNEVVDAKGAIRVYARVRPLLAAEAGLGQLPAVSAHAASDSVQVIWGREGGVAPEGGLSDSKKTLRFTLDAAFGPTTTQAAVYAHVAPVVTSVLDGYNVCIFAYGATGVGKTYTMEGSEADPGINRRTLANLFARAQDQALETAVEMHVSLLEVYLDRVYDLLAPPPAPGAERRPLEVRGGGAASGAAPGAIEVRVGSAGAAWEALAGGLNTRASAATGANARSSRSHCLLCVRVAAASRLTGDLCHARLWLVDLAGSERVERTGAAGARLAEAQAINRSLAALGDVIHALAQRAQHVPFRNSKLTTLLADSMGGNSKVLMFVNLSPAEGDAGESLCSLNFAARVRGVKLGPAVRNVEDGAHIRALKQELAALRAEAAELQAAVRRSGDESAVSKQCLQCQRTSNSSGTQHMVGNGDGGALLGGARQSAAVPEWAGSTPGGSSKLRATAKLAAPAAPPPRAAWGASPAAQARAQAGDSMPAQARLWPTALSLGFTRTRRPPQAAEPAPARQGTAAESPGAQGGAPPVRTAPEAQRRRSGPAAPPQLRRMLAGAGPGIAKGSTSVRVGGQHAVSTAFTGLPAVPGASTAEADGPTAGQPAPVDAPQPCAFNCEPLTTSGSKKAIEDENIRASPLVSAPSSASSKENHPGLGAGHNGLLTLKAQYAASFQSFRNMMDATTQSGPAVS